MQIVALLTSFLLLQTGHSFSPSSNLSANRISLPRQDGNVVIFSAPDDTEIALENSTLKASENGTPETAVSKKMEPSVTESTPYPIDLPSPLLLSASMVLAITSTGSLFELTGGTPTLGFGPQAALAAIGLPSSLFLIYAAILKGAAETEEDDKQYNKPRSF